MKAILIPIWISSLALLLSSCATTGEEPQTVEQLLAERGYTIGPSVERILQFRIDGWNYLDRQHVIVSVSVSRDYLVSLRTSCNGLFGANVIAFSNTGSYLTNFDWLLVRDHTRVLERCPIESLNELVKSETDSAA